MTVLVLAGNCGTRKQKSSRALPTVAYETVRRQTVTRTIKLLGTVQGDQQATAMSKLAGRVTEIVRPEGSYVSEGEPIAFVVNDVPGMDYKPGPVTAPVSGQVGKVYVEPGQSVAPGVPVALVARYSERVRVRATVSDQDLRFIRPGARGDVSVVAFPDTTFTGTVARVTPVLDQMSRTATVELTVDNRGRHLIPGVACAVQLTLEQRDSVVALPLTALFTNGLSRIAVLDGNKARFREVRLGLVGDRAAEVVTGIEPGERVITTGKERVRDGDEVKPVEAGQP
jgi:multidrug efflux pump subunit AcrA (membrane-fusion protein)